MDLYEFGTLVFDDETMKSRLPAETYASLRHTIDAGDKLDLSVANVVAACMKDWAMEKGATHYCHWFMPMTGMTSEKHDAFLDIKKGKAIAVFSGKNLIKGEPDASSFPSGGLRATSEARGYTAWDCTSPAFLRDGSLCIPTAFCSYTGQALDKKTPLLRSMDAINAAGKRFASMIGLENVGRVYPSVGAEQEYFLIDADVYAERPDLMLTGRTLLGRLPGKGQEMHDHYFGSLKMRVAAFMADLDRELWRLGIPSKTKHNESAPAQHEIAPVFEIANVATDHNYLTMDVMKKVAERHSLVCLLHEKPFEGINGSGKHNNWSLTTDTGVNLLDPGKRPEKNLPFLLTLAAVIRAVDDGADLLRMSVSTAIGNDHRLGGYEAPPGIISIYLGEWLAHIIDEIETGHGTEETRKAIRHGVKSLPDFIIDNSDRNRTSPFAFTGNKFEFRMVGSSASIAGPNTILNAIVADSLNKLCDALEGDYSEENAYAQVRRIFMRHSRIIFNGNNYSYEWVMEAERRGLSVINDSVRALKVLKDADKCRVLVETGTFTQQELESRYEISMDNYAKKRNIEARVMSDMLRISIEPRCIEYLTTLLKAYNQGIKTGLSINMSYLSRDIEELNTAISELDNEIAALLAAHAAARETKEVTERAEKFRDEVLPVMNRARGIADRLEGLVSQDFWPIPTYFELFYKV